MHLHCHLRFHNKAALIKALRFDSSCSIISCAVLSRLFDTDASNLQTHTFQ
eukprot:m.33538 g.33538  ORF g.33538 m.33538 type:complete len:51 (+) comp14241_c0_seq2:1209-1361(+)